jgi:hypothetical protein
MRQIGTPPEIDQQMDAIVREALNEHGFDAVDATTTAGRKDFLERIIDLIRSTGLTIAIFSHETRSTALANIMLELGFAAIFGKPLLIIKSKEAAAPSDLTRTDWIEFQNGDLVSFKQKVAQALEEVSEIAKYQEMLLDIALDAPKMDCAVAFERAQKAFLLSPNAELLAKIEAIKLRVMECRDIEQMSDLHRLHDEISAFFKQGSAHFQAD